MRLVSDWSDVLRRAWSIRFILLAGILSGAEVALPLVDGLLPIPAGVFAGLSFLATAGAFVARIAAQQNLGDAK